MSLILEDFNSLLERRFSRAYAEQSNLDWVCANTTMGGKPFSVEGYEFQRDIMNDMHPNLCVRKSAQTGLTEVQIRKVLAFVTRNPRVNAIFTMPSDALFRRISQTRFRPIVDYDRVFNLESDKEAVRSLGILQFQHSFLYLTAASEGDATSTSADAVFNDEVDLTDQSMLALFNSRLQNSDLKINQGFSTPTFESFGIDAMFKASDQRHYFHRCTACNHFNLPEFNLKFCRIPDLPSHINDLMEIDDDIYASLDLKNCFVMCERCGRKLEPDAPREWVTKFPGRTNARGYDVSPFATTRITLDYIIGQLVKYKKKDFTRGFVNTVLGKTYSDAQTQIPTECIEAAMVKGSPNIVELPNETPLALGLDMGQTCYLVVGNANGKELYLFEQIPASKVVERIEQLVKSKNIVAGAVDRLPYTPTAEEIARKTKNVVLPMQYSTSKDSDLKLVEDEHEQLTHFSANRTRALDEVSTLFKNYDITLSGYGYQKQILHEHLRDMVRQELPEKPATWQKISGSDHYMHAIALYLASLRVRPLVLEHTNGPDTGSQFLFSTSTMKSGIPSGLPGFSPKRIF